MGEELFRNDRALPQYLRNNVFWVSFLRFEAGADGWTPPLRNARAPPQYLTNIVVLREFSRVRGRRAWTKNSSAMPARLHNT